MDKARSKKPEDQVMVMLFTETVYALWKQRNRKLFDNGNLPVHSLVRDIIFNTACNCNEKQRSLLIQ